MGDHEKVGRGRGRSQKIRSSGSQVRRIAVFTPKNFRQGCNCIDSTMNLSYKTGAACSEGNGAAHFVFYGQGMPVRQGRRVPKGLPFRDAGGEAGRGEQNAAAPGARRALRQIPSVICFANAASPCRTERGRGRLCGRKRRPLGTRGAGAKRLRGSERSKFQSTLKSAPHFGGADDSVRPQNAPFFRRSAANSQYLSGRQSRRPLQGNARLHPDSP